MTGPLAKGVTKVVKVVGRAGVPVGARAVLLSVTATGGSTSGTLTVSGSGSVPAVAFTAKRATHELVLLPLTSTGNVSFLTYAGGTDVRAAVGAAGPPDRPGRRRRPHLDWAGDDLPLRRPRPADPSARAGRAAPSCRPDLLSDLNPEQRAAVEHRGGPLLIVAGAGSGKTRVLTRRIAHLLATGDARPGEILAITFTNKAAGEMRERVVELVGNRARVMWVSTFHSACVRILRKEAPRLGMTSTFSIYDAAD